MTRKSIRDRTGLGQGDPHDTEAFYESRRTAWDQKTGYSLQNECDYIDGLGSWAPRQTRSRRYLLEKYLDTLPKRVGFTATEVQVLTARAMVHLEREK